MATSHRPFNQKTRLLQQSDEPQACLNFNGQVCLVDRGDIGYDEYKLLIWNVNKFHAASINWLAK